MRVCEQCGKPLKVSQYAGQRHAAKFCTNECRKRYRAEYKREQQGTTCRDETMRTCQCCGKAYMSVKSHQKYCSPQCKYLRQKKQKTCKCCGIAMRVVTTNQKYCSVECRITSTRLVRQSRGKRPAITPKLVELRTAAMRDSWSLNTRLERRTINSPPLGTLD